MHHRTSIEELTLVLAAELQSYSEEITEDIKDEVKKVAKDCVKQLKETSPEDSGEYKTGWKAKVETEGKNNLTMRVYNAKVPQRTHLLEFGHVNVDGGRTEGIPHIYPAQEKAKEALLEKAIIKVARK